MKELYRIEMGFKKKIDSLAPQDISLGDHWSGRTGITAPQWAD